MGVDEMGVGEIGVGEMGKLKREAIMKVVHHIA